MMIINKIKNQKEYNLAELIQAVWSGKLEAGTYEQSNSEHKTKTVSFSKSFNNLTGSGASYSFGTNYSFDEFAKFSVGEDEEIDEHTEFERFGVVTNDGDFTIYPYDYDCVNNVLEYFEDYTVKEIHAVINKELTCIWKDYS